MNNAMPISILQATSAIKNYADIQEKLIKEFENQYHSFENESNFRIKPKTVILYAVDEK